jgi:dolichol-phosphate hexosyltransferase
LTYTSLDRLDTPNEKIQIVVVIPVLNERESIGKVIDGILAVMKDKNFRVLVVDGHSTDDTIEIAKRHGAQVIPQRGRGYGDGLLHGFNYANSIFDPQILVMLDGDGTYDPTDIPRLVEPITKGEADLVVGNRFPRMDEGSMSLTNRIGNRLISWLARNLLRDKISDTQCGMRAFRADLVDELTGQVEGMTFATEMLVDLSQVRARVIQVPIAYHSRTGETKLSPFRDGASIGGTTLRLMRDYRPLLFFGAIGAAIILFGLVLGSSVISEWITTGTVTRVPTAILTALLVVVGIQFFSLGLIADMIKGIKKSRSRV